MNTYPKEVYRSLGKKPKMHTHDSLSLGETGPVTIRHNEYAPPDEFGKRTHWGRSVRLPLSSDEKVTGMWLESLCLTDRIKLSVIQLTDDKGHRTS